MTKLTKDGITTTKNLGEENYESFYSSALKKKMIQYDYRHVDGSLFSCVKPTLSECRLAKVEWLKKRLKEK